MRSPVPRREEEKSLYFYLEKIGKFVDRWPKIIIVGGSLGVFAGWFGSQLASPGRITHLEGRTTLGFDSVDARLDSLELEQLEDRLLRADVRLMLKITCRPITDTDLREDCVDRGARVRSRR